MKHGAVMADIVIGTKVDVLKLVSQLHSNPTYITEGVVHYWCNMPGAVARTSTKLLENSTFAFTLALANKGYKKTFER